MAAVKAPKQVSIQVTEPTPRKDKVKDRVKKGPVNFDLTPARGPRQLPGLVHVYIPQLHRQATEKSLSTPLSEALTAVVEAGLGDRLDKSRTPAVQAADKVMSQLAQGLKKNKVGVDVKRPVPVECYTPWDSSQHPDVTFLCPMELDRVAVQLQEPGFACLELRALDEEDISDTYRGLLASDVNRRVSPRLTYDLLHKVLVTVLSKKSNTNLSSVKLVKELTDNDAYLGLELPDGWRVELVPAMLPRDENMYYVAKPYRQDPVPGSNHLWRFCFSPAEADLLKSVSSTDKGQRAQAVTLVTRMCQRHVNLRVLHAYHVQTAMLHDIDVHVDLTPRWQRSAPEQCVLSVLRRLLAFVRDRRLPHFFLQDLNLLQSLTSRQLTMARSALERLASSDDAVVSLLKRLIMPQVTLEEKFENVGYDSDSSTSSSSEPVASESSTAIVLPDLADDVASKVEENGEAVCGKFPTSFPSVKADSEDENESRQSRLSLASSSTLSVARTEDTSSQRDAASNQPDAKNGEIVSRLSCAAPEAAFLLQRNINED